MTQLLIIAIVGGLALLWLHMSAVRELALRAAKRHCRDMWVQFLDGSVFLDRVRLTRSQSGNLVLAQRFKFEFTVSGERRYQGETVFNGKRQASMHLEPHVIRDNDPQSLP